MRERLFDLIAAEIPDDIPVDCLPDVDAIVDHLLAAGVIVPPCKVGDTVYVVRTRTKIAEFTARYFIYEHKNILVYGDNEQVVDCCFCIGKDFGKTVFLTRQEAEKALAERREG